MKIFLIGLPGSGKSTMGKELARVMGLPFIDLDEEIEKRVGESVTNIFNKHGEEFFRVKESIILEDIIRTVPEFVMATGGGAPCYHAGMELMNTSGVTIFLDIPVEEIALRMSDDEKSIRPLLSSTPPGSTKEQLVNLRQQRLMVYQQAKITVSNPAFTVDAIIKMVYKAKM